MSSNFQSDVWWSWILFGPTVQPSNPSLTRLLCAVHSSEPQTKRDRPQKEKGFDCPHRDRSAISDRACSSHHHVIMHMQSTLFGEIEWTIIARTELNQLEWPTSYTNSFSRTVSETLAKVRVNRKDSKPCSDYLSGTQPCFVVQRGDSRVIWLWMELQFLIALSVEHPFQMKCPKTYVFLIMR